MTSIERELETLKESKSGGRFTKEQFERVVSYTQVFNNMTLSFVNVLNEAQNGSPISLYRNILETSGPHDTFATLN